jgi:hypothetical protein
MGKAKDGHDDEAVLASSSFCLIFDLIKKSKEL